MTLGVCKVVIVAKDLKIIFVLQTKFRSSQILLCHFHVTKYIRKVVYSLSVSSEIKCVILRIVNSLLYASLQEEYDEVYDDLPSNEDIPLTYYSNWHSCRNLWCKLHRNQFQIFGNNTNNRNENFTKQLKRILYCMCRKVDNERLMVVCDICRNWCHADCVKFRAAACNKEWYTL